MNNLQEIERYARENHIPVMLNGTKEVLIKLCEENNPQNILEIGTAIGYSGIVMLLASNEAKLQTIEINENSFNIAKQNFADFKLTNRVNLYLEDAEIVINKLEEKFDFIFLDGPKGQYIKYLPRLLELLCDGGILVADDINFKGWVLDNIEYPKKHRTMANKLKLFVEEIKNNPHLKTEFLNVGEGLSISKKI